MDRELNALTGGIPGTVIVRHWVIKLPFYLVKKSLCLVQDEFSSEEEDI